jgi:hypothetical protein
MSKDDVYKELSFCTGNTRLAFTCQSCMKPCSLKQKTDYVPGTQANDPLSAARQTDITLSATFRTPKKKCHSFVTNCMCSRTCSGCIPFFFRLQFAYGSLPVWIMIRDCWCRRRHIQYFAPFFFLQLRHLSNLSLARFRPVESRANAQNK